MAQYIVRSGQNIYDVALALYGSVEGIFDLLVSNSWLNMTTQLTYGMVLSYNKQFVINKDITIWLKDNDILVRNGEHICSSEDIEHRIKEHIQTYHTELYNSIHEMSPDEQNMFWETLYTPRMVINHQGQVTSINLRLKENKHLIVDWGDYSPVEIIETVEEQEIEHCYKGSSTHKITLYGDFEFDLLDFSNLNGIYYPLGTIYADKFISNLNIKDLNTMIITQ